MEKLGARTSLGYYVRWEEVNVSSDKGRREMHYYLGKPDGILDLAVIGKEKSLRHMSYHLPNNYLSLAFPITTPSRKLRSRREVVDWLNFVVSAAKTPFVGLSENGGLPLLEIEAFKDNQLKKLGHFTKEFMWLGSAWTCRKRRHHYQSFQKNGVKISVQDFVYVLAEEDKRLVAYLEDMYEDSKGHKMVVVRWFHKIDEVGFNLPHNFNDREIFFSLCLQDLNIECIDGLASVLSPQHFNEFLSKASHTKLYPFVCHKMFEEDEVRPFDITRLKGYWRQEIIGYMHSLVPSKDQENSEGPVDDPAVGGQVDGTACLVPRKRCFRLRDNDVHSGLSKWTDGEGGTLPNCHNNLTNCKNESQIFSPGDKSGGGRKMKQSSLLHVKVGSEVEVFSQDSGIRGCWFRASVVKMNKDKVKVRYLDLKDAADEEKQLEEWILGSRVAAPDLLGIRDSGRTILRPSPWANKGRVSWAFDVGMAVDVWWHDAWWEGIVLRKESGDKYHVYFPGETRQSIFSESDLRHSQEWLGNAWKCVKERPDIVSTTPSLSATPNHIAVMSEEAQSAAYISMKLEKDEAGNNGKLLGCGIDERKELGMVPDLSKDDTLGQLRWSTSKKRKRGSGNFKSKLDLNIDGNKCNIGGSSICERFLFPMPFQADLENCKYVGNHSFSSTVVQPLGSLVMSR